MLLYCIIFLLVVVYWPVSMFWEQDILWARGISNYIDWPVHFAQASKVHYQSFIEWYTHNPFVYGARNTYPFWADVPSGLLLRLGLPFKAAFLIPSVLFTILFFYCTYRFLKKRSFSNNSMAAVLFLFLFASMPTGEGTQPQLWLNTFSPNRSLLITFSLLLVVYDIFSDFLTSQSVPNLKTRAMTWFKLTSITLVMCMTHPHTLLSTAVLATVFSIAIFIKKRKIPVESIAWAITSLAIILTFKHYLWSEATMGYPIFRPNWTQERFAISPWMFWPTYGGVVYLLGIYFGIVKKRYLELAIILILTTLHLLFQWQINEYDNIKNTLIMMFLCTVLIVEFFPFKKWLPVFCIICALPSLKEWTEIYPLATREEMALADKLQAETPKNYVAIIDSRHNHPVPMFTSIPVMAWWDFYSWTLGLRNNRETIFRMEMLRKPRDLTFKKPLLVISRDDGSYSDYETSGRFKDLTGVYLQFDKSELKDLPVFDEGAGYKVYRKFGIEGQ
ncbi:hypothetical protein ACLSU7_12935 [Bdellovibrio sp. HCB185ZH]|uniref:hypothetical protein n=1 Tax=Bdellovibrio sp. HCB185ZH TaxID=3394235 RepID=UPI0039A68E24